MAEKRNWLLLTSLGILLVLGIIFRPEFGKIPSQTDFGANVGSREETFDSGQLILPEENATEIKATEEKMANKQVESGWATPPEMTIDQAKDYRAVLFTSKGRIVIDLAEKTTPITVNNFVFLANQGFYNGVIFHRVIEGFMIQGGCPNGDGTGGPGYQFADESFEGQYVRGIVAMANSGPNTNGSQFFIMHQDYNLLPDYVIFGQVVEGMEVVDKIATASVEANSFGENSSPVNPVAISRVEVVAE